MTQPPKLSDAYAMSSAEEVKSLYREWAHSYDMGFGDAQGYQLAKEVADAFVVAGGTGPVLDVGAGTGLVAERLHARKVGPIDGLDLSDDMLGVAHMKDIYHDLHVGDVNHPLDLPVPNYSGVVSAGTFTLGHVGPSALTNLLNIAASGAVFVISVNIKHFEVAGFGAFIDSLSDQISGLIVTDVRIYDDRADAGHRHDLARLVSFRKI